MAVSAPVSFEVSIAGEVDDMREEIYAQQNGEVWPTAKTNAVDIAKAGIRYQAMIGQLSLLANFEILPESIERTGRTADAPAQTYEFTITFYRDRVSYLKTEDENNPGTILEGVDAIKRAIARAIAVDYVQNYSFWDPTVTVTRTNTNTTEETTPPRGWAYEAVTAEKLYADITAAEAAITVTEI